MAEVPGSLDRLPWLDSAAPGASPRLRAARRARRPLLLLLGLFGAGVIALVAFLAGRANLFNQSPASNPPTVLVAPLTPRPTPPPAPPAAAPLAAPVAEPPAAPAASAPRRAAPARHRAAAKRYKRAIHRRHRAAPRRPVRRPAVVVHRNVLPARPVQRSFVVPRRLGQWPARPFDGASGKVIQLGAYLTLRDADAAWWRLVRVYPYLGTLPRLVTWIGPTPGRARYYRVRLAASSRREARALCTNLHRIGRGCMVVVQAK